MRSGVPAWKRLTHHPLSPSDRVPLVTDLFSDRDEVQEAVKHISTDEAQSFVDVLDEVPLHFYPKRVGSLTGTRPFRINGRH